MSMITNKRIAVLRAEGGIALETYDDDLQLLEAQMYRFCARNGGNTDHIDAVWKQVKKEIRKDFKKGGAA